MVLVIVVVNQSIMGRPPLQDKLSTRTTTPQLFLRQSRQIQIPADANLLVVEESDDMIAGSERALDDLIGEIVTR